MQARIIGRGDSHIQMIMMGGDYWKFFFIKKTQSCQYLVLCERLKFLSPLRDTNY